MPIDTLARLAGREGPDAFHQRLSHWNRRRIAVRSPECAWPDEIDEDARMLKSEGAFIEGFRALARDAASQAPRDPNGFVAWFETLKDEGPGQWDPLFDWLAGEASMEEMRWFLTQEAAGEAGFDDLVAMTQVKLPERAKLELARNYWDEMGRGSAGGMHGPMLDRTVHALELTPSIEETCWASLCLANTMTALATTRRYAIHSVGALGVVELTAPTRVELVAEGLRRLGAPPIARKYFALHAHLDVEHSRSWNAEALAPLVEADPQNAQWLAEGAIMRLMCGERCFEAYRGELWGHAHRHAAE